MTEVQYLGFYVIYYCLMLYYIMLCSIMFYYIMSCHIILYYIFYDKNICVMVSE
jgi:hypothetical protein